MSIDLKGKSPATSLLPSRPVSRSKAAHHLSAGALSGFTSAICLQPLDLLKTRLQQESGDVVGVKRRKISTTLKEVVRDDGILGLWRGTIPTLVRNVPGVAIYFYALSAIRTELSYIPQFQTFSSPSPSSSSTSTSTSTSVSTLSSADASTSTSIATSPQNNRSALVKLSVPGNLIAGAIARTSVGFVLNPITVLKARYESNRYTEYRSLLTSLKDLVRTSGVRGLFQGVTATAARDAPYAGMYLVCYEKGKEVASRLILPEWGVPSSLLYSGCGATAAMMATFATSPADCVKTRMQVQPIEHPSIRKAVARIYKDRGLSGFFSGSSLRISRKAASSAIAWTVYEALLMFLRDQHLDTNSNSNSNSNTAIPA